MRIVFKYFVVQLLCVRVCVQVMQLVLLGVFVCLQKNIVEAIRSSGVEFRDPEFFLWPSVRKGVHVLRV